MTTEVTYPIEIIDINDVLVDSGLNARKVYDTEHITKLASDIQKVGLIHNPLVMEQPTGKKYKLISGFCRFKAMKDELRWKNIKCKIRPFMPIEEQMRINASENLQRSDFTLYEECLLIESFYKRGYSHRQLIKLLNLSYGFIQLRLIAVRLPSVVMQGIKGDYVKQSNLHDLNKINRLEGAEALVEALLKLRNAKKTKKKVVLRVASKNDTVIRTPQAVSHMVDALYDLYGSNTDSIGVVCQALKWAMGGISNAELQEELKHSWGEFVYPDSLIEAKVFGR